MSRKLVVEIVGDASSLQKAFAKSSKSAQQFNGNVTKSKKGFSGLTKGIGLVTGALGAAGLAGAARAAFSEMADGQKVAAQTNAVLKSTGKAANVTAEHVDELANSILKKTGIDDEAIKSGENLLLTFTNIRNEVGKGNDIFDQATRTIADMSTALGQDMKSSAIQLGKALNDPVKGVTALRRVGVSFTKAQQDQIKSLVNTGHTLEAQKLILRELNKEFGGSAVAAGKTLPGQLNILRETLLNLGGSIAETLTPTVTKLVQSMTKWLSNSKNQKTVLDTVKAAASAVATVLKTLKAAFDVLSAVVGGNKNAIIALVAAYATFKAVSIAASVAKLAATFGVLTTATEGATLAFMGPAGLVVGAGVAAFAVTTLFLKLTDLDEKLKAVGSAAFDLAANLGLVNDPMKQFEGKTNLLPADMKFLERRAAQLRKRGLTQSQAVDELLRTHPNLARKDVEVAAGIGFQRNLTINGGLHLHGVQNPKQMEAELQKRAKARARVRRGAS